MELYILWIFVVLLAALSFVIHELGHWLVLARCRVPVVEFWMGLGPMLGRLGRWRLGLFPIGAAVVAEPTAFAAMTPAQRFFAALGGPLASAAYGTMLAAVASLDGSDTGRLLEAVAMLNLALAGLNLLPIPPLDGFRMFETFLEMRGRPLSPRALSNAYRLGNGLVFALGTFVITWGFLS